MSTGASTLKVTLPDGRIVQYQRVSYDPEEPHSHYDIVLPRTRTSNLDCYAEGFASTDFGLSRGLVLDNGAGFVPPYPLPEKVFVKWAERGDSERAAGLAREADFYNKELKELQGKNVPEFYGHYVAQTDVGQRAPFVLNVYERCGWADVKADEGDGGASVLNAKADSDEYLYARLLLFLLSILMSYFFSAASICSQFVLFIEPAYRTTNSLWPSPHQYMVESCSRHSIRARRGST